MTIGVRLHRIRIAVAVLSAFGISLFPRLAVAGEHADTASADTAVQTRHAIAVDGRQLAYTAGAGTLRVRLDKSDAEAAIFYGRHRLR
jgi:hypothetical protein